MALAPYAVSDQNSKGREVKDDPLGPDRNEFQRDLTRIQHSVWYRKLASKTQVFAAHEGDCFRTRASHSTEVEQISRSVARSLSLNEDLAGVLALAHDLGHAPFGHCGQDVLDELMKDHGGFEHNFQGLRIVTELDRTYPNFDGLNLMFETREGILKHCSPSNAILAGKPGERHLTGGHSSLEAQLVNWCDAIAYSHADLEDGLHEKILTIQQVEEGVPDFARHLGAVREKYPHLPQDDWRIVYAAIRGMMKDSIKDLIENSQSRILASGVQSPDDVRKQKEELIAFSPEMADRHFHLKRFMKKNMYHHPSILEGRQEQEEALKVVFEMWVSNPASMPKYDPQDDRPLYRQVCDNVASLTDREALVEYKRALEIRNGEELTERFPKSIAKIVRGSKP